MNKLTRLIVASLILSSVTSCMLLPAFSQSYQGTYKNNYNSSNNAYHQNYNNGYNSNYSMPPLKGNVVVIPAGTVLSATSNNALSSEFLTTGDTVSVSLDAPFSYNGMSALPAGTMVEGNVVFAEKGGLAGKPGKLKIKFTNAITPSGNRIPLSGKLATDDGTGLLVGGTTAGRYVNAAKKGAVGAGLGALIGTFMGPLSGGKVGKGAIYGTAVGGGLGLGSSIISRGTDAVLPAGSPVNIILDQPTSVNSNQGY